MTEEDREKHALVIINMVALIGDASAAGQSEVRVQISDMADMIAAARASGEAEAQDEREACAALVLQLAQSILARKKEQR